MHPKRRPFKDREDAPLPRCPDVPALPLPSLEPFIPAEGGPFADAEVEAVAGGGAPDGPAPSATGMDLATPAMASSLSLGRVLVEPME
jgi:hypothetical protein